ncbi:unnamed protein product [Hydatigera taeniaeformis]|uniref:C2H2-type domain-containing protein n=1 Tax=Hydatigena taeniaeformis TaxID=6205 RepID=A0A0R3WLL0_HYDTA|nr:unnamed protein product [Hydatigera taeniaeformis]
MVQAGVALSCQWLHCEVVLDIYSDFCRHLLDHLQVEWSSSSNITCGVCGNPLGRDESAYRHIYFHAWLVFLNARGSFYQTSEKLPSCKLPEDFSSIPDFPTPFCCAWNNCSFQTNDVASLYSHVSKHPQADNLNGDDGNKVQQHACLWDSCSFTCSRLTNLVAHLRSHTQEKVVACPQCGLLFTARTKLRDHLVRQHQIEDPTSSTAINTYQCTYCLRCFGNKSLLQAHANRHINKHICPLCNLTLHSKSAVKRHMLFRHTDKATVSCPHCSATIKGVHSLDLHISRCHHQSYSFKPGSGVECQRSGLEPQRSTTVTPVGPLAVTGSSSLGEGHLFPLQTSTFNATGLVKATVFRCSVEGCKFYSTTRPGLCVHMTRKHPPEEPQGNYACHLCPMRTTKGFLLSRHLISKHNHQRPSGHFRFNYVLCPEDGLYRLQTTRLDSVEVATALLGPQTVDQLLTGGASEEVGEDTGDLDCHPSLYGMQHGLNATFTAAGT